MDYAIAAAEQKINFTQRKILLLHALSYFMLHDTYRDVLILGLDFTLGRAVTGWWLKMCELFNEVRRGNSVSKLQPSWRINYPPTAICGHYERELEGASWQPSMALGDNGPKYITNIVLKISLGGSKPGKGFTFKLCYMITRNSWSLTCKYSFCCCLNHAICFGFCSQIVHIRV